MLDNSLSRIYRGRFAPSPTGPLHFGSLVAALGSYLDARDQAGEWLLRMEDLDLPRCQVGAVDDILHTLAAFGFMWDGPVLYQSQRNEAYQAALEQLDHENHLFACVCTRRELADSQLSPATASDGALIYPGTCRSGLPSGRSARAWRVRCQARCIRFEDQIQGPISQQLDQEVGDFILRRADGLFAYQLAVVVDDAAQGINHIVRGADLLDSTARQIYLQQLLGFATPTYAHLPIALNTQGEKLSKQTLATPLQIEQAPALLHAALRFLGQTIPDTLRRAQLKEIWAWAHSHWRLSDIPHQRTMPSPLISH